MRLRAVVLATAALVATFYLAVGGAAEAKVSWSSQHDPRARLALSVKSGNTVDPSDYLIAYGRQSVVTEYNGAYEDNLYSSLHILGVAPAKRCPRRPPIVRDFIAADASYEGLDEPRFKESFLNEWEEERACGYLVRDLDPEVFDDVKRYAVIARAEKLIPASAATKKLREEEAARDARDLEAGEKAKKAAPIVLGILVWLVLMGGLAYLVVRGVRRLNKSAPPPPSAGWWGSAPPPSGSWTEPAGRRGPHAGPRAPPPPAPKAGEPCPMETSASGKPKKPFRDQADAEHFIEKNRDRYALDHAYECPYFDHWHVS